MQRVKSSNHHFFVVNFSHKINFSGRKYHCYFSLPNVYFLEFNFHSIGQRSTKITVKSVLKLKIPKNFQKFYELMY